MTYKTLQRLIEASNRAPRALIMAGSPGSGKSTVARPIVAGTNAKWIDVDQVTQHIAKKNNLDLTQSDVGDAIQPHARHKNLRRRQWLIDARADLLVDGTGRDLDGIKQFKEKLEAAGYVVGMVFVAVDLDIALARNAARDRRVPTKFLEDTWHDVMGNLRHLHSLFDIFFYVRNNETPDAGVIAKAHKFLDAR